MGMVDPKPPPKPRVDKDGHRIVEPPRKEDERVDAPGPLKRMGQAPEDGLIDDGETWTPSDGRYDPEHLA